ncbi:hypothetical protein BDK51DRAFT_32846, partial [Blyttiomyces helicus]
ALPAPVFATKPQHRRYTDMPQKERKSIANKVLLEKVKTIVTNPAFTLEGTHGADLERELTTVAERASSRSTAVRARRRSTSPSPVVSPLSRNTASSSSSSPAESIDQQQQRPRHRSRSRSKTRTPEEKGKAAAPAPVPVPTTPRVRRPVGPPAAEWDAQPQAPKPRVDAALGLPLPTTARAAPRVTVRRASDVGGGWQQNAESAKLAVGGIGRVIVDTARSLVAALWGVLAARPAEDGDVAASDDEFDLV